MEPAPRHTPDPATPAGGYRNVHGRRAGRGWRPVLIVLKLCGVAAVAGGLFATVAGVLLVSGPADAAAWRAHADLLSRLYLRAILPGLALAVGSGILLAASIWRVMVRMRWFQLKMAILVAALPSLHLYLSGRSLALAGILAPTTPDLAQAAVIRSHMLAGTLAALAVAVAALILGRVKPRLGQDYARTFARKS